jgi:hypothetical protein
LLIPKVVGGFAVLACLVAPCLVAPWHPGENKVKVTVVVIVATDRSDEIDPRLKLIAAEVQKCNKTLTGFSLESMTSKSLAVDEKAVFALRGKKSVVVVVQQAADKTNTVGLAVTPPEQGEIVYRTVCGKFLPIVTRCQSCGQVSPAYVARALGSAAGPGLTAPVLGGGVAVSGKSRERLILAIRVQPCNGK